MIYVLYISFMQKITIDRRAHHNRNHQITCWFENRNNFMQITNNTIINWYFFSANLYDISSNNCSIMCVCVCVYAATSTIVRKDALLITDSFFLCCMPNQPSER